MKLQIALIALFAGCGGENPMSDGGADAGARPVRSCSTTFKYTPGMHVASVGVAGEWNDFTPSATPMDGPDDSGAWSAKVKLPVGAFAYKVVIGSGSNATWLMDPANPYSKYVNGTENSVVEIDDCKIPEIQFVSIAKDATGAADVVARYVDGAEQAGADPASIAATVDGAPVAVAFDPASGRIALHAGGLAVDKHRLIVAGADRAGRRAADLHVPFWIEARPFDFRDGVLYFAFTDRFRDGDPANNAPLPDIDPRANYAGGDFAGITQAIDEGYLDALGVRTLWVSPPFKNPEHFELGADGRHYSGYHGYWPTDGRAPEERFGDAAAFRAMVKAAHRHGIRVLVDSVLNHVHRDHQYFLDHRNDGWFNGDGSCVCGGPNCDWDAHRLDCWFADYLPDLDYETWPALVAMVDDALAWARDFDVDGFRVDAVKHFPHAVGRRLRSKLHDLYEHDPALAYYLVGETFTGASDGERAFIQSYIGPSELAAQFDFPMYWNILGAFAQGGSLKNLEGAAGATDAVFGDEPMSPFLGNHDVPRFITTASGMLVGDGKDQAWTAPPPAPSTDAPYAQLRLALAFLITQPGVPLVYYGDEYGQPGAGDPDNRRPMKWSGLTPSEQATLDLARKAGAARRALPPLQRGKRYTMWVDDDLYVYARTLDGATAVVAVNRGGARPVAVPVRPEAPLPDGTVLHDRLGGPDVTVAGGKLPLDLPPATAAIYAP